MHHGNHHEWAQNDDAPSDPQPQPQVEFPVQRGANNTTAPTRQTKDTRSAGPPLVWTQEGESAEGWGQPNCDIRNIHETHESNAAGTWARIHRQNAQAHWWVYNVGACSDDKQLSDFISSCLVVFARINGTSECSKQLASASVSN